MTRITPARAGKTRRGICSASHCRDHPRACGENSSPSSRFRAVRGSPPRVRGKPGHRLALLLHGGITPARAGKTHRPTRRRSETSDHPRACGENCAAGHETPCRRGSPPRVRGKPMFARIAEPIQGITPARAGKTDSVRLAEDRLWDHPRACGENSFVKFPIKMSLGSPPRVRGKLYLLRDSLDRIGITPARAGKTRSSILNTVSRKDHPRACGENSICKAP